MRVNKYDTDSIVRIFLLLSAMAILIYCFSYGISGNDFWWHIKVGEWIVKNKSVPTQDIFSWIGKENNIPWTAHEWAADVIFYFIHMLFGSIGIFIFSLSCAIILVLLIFIKVKYYITQNIFISGMFLLLFVVSVSCFFYGRPHIFSYFLLFAELNILYSFEENQESKFIYLLPLIACLWSNLHGGSASLSYILCFVFFLISLIKIENGRVTSNRKNKKAIIKLFMVLLLTAAGIFVNPIGLKVFIYPYVNLSDKLQMSFISEWQAPDVKNIEELILYFLPILLVIIGFITETKNIKLIDIAVMALFLFLFFRSKRFIMLWYIAAPFCAFGYFPLCKIKKVRNFERVFLFVLMTIVAASMGFSTYKIFDKAKSDNLISTVVSDEMITVIKEDNTKHIFNDYNIGEALIYNNIDVFFDSRADLYSYGNILENGLSLIFLENVDSSSSNRYVDVNVLIEQYEFDGIVILKNRPLYSYLINNPEKFTLAFEDDSSGYFKVNKKLI